MLQALLTLREALSENGFNTVLEAELGVGPAKRFAAMLAEDSADPPDAEEVRRVRPRPTAGPVVQPRRNRDKRAGSVEDRHMGQFFDVRIRHCRGDLGARIGVRVRFH